MIIPYSEPVFKKPFPGVFGVMLIGKTHQNRDERVIIIKQQTSFLIRPARIYFDELLGEAHRDIPLVWCKYIGSNSPSPFNPSQPKIRTPVRFVMTNCSFRKLRNMRLTWTTVNPRASPISACVIGN